MSIKEKIRQIYDLHGRLMIFACAATFMWAAMYCVYDVSTACWPGKAAHLLIVLCEALFINSFILVLRGRWRIILPVIIWVTGLFMLGNVLYYRYSGDLLPLSLSFRGESYNSFVFSAVPTLFCWSDMIYILCPAVVTVLYGTMHVSHARILRASRGWICVAVCFLIWLGSHFMGAYSQYRYCRAANVPVRYGSILHDKFVPHRTGARRSLWYWNEMLVYLYQNIFTPNPYSRIELDDTQRSMIGDFIRTNSGAEKTWHDSIFALNKDKNLILLVVESLNADAVGLRINGQPITPTLDSLINVPGTISCLSMVTQVSTGASSDGQFMYNTGLLPLRGDAVAMLYADNTYRSLVRELGYQNSSEIIVEDGYIWNHDATSAAYGYKKLVDGVDDGTTLRDARMISRGLEEIGSTPQPFMLQLVTLSMHYPFNDPGMAHPSWINGHGSPIENRYLMAVNAFDAELKRLIDGLKDMGVYENTVIVVVSDHDQDPLGDSEQSHPIVFMAVNTGVSQRIYRPVGQIDVFPTIKQIMGKCTGWQGVGMSILDDRNSSTVDASGNLYGTSSATVDESKRRAWEISELIVRSDFLAE